MDRSSYGGPPQSTIGNSARRIQAQLPAEPPACVQNAMMRRDKQPFTYTPGGIDLSQIKSPRMAKRISRNANSEGVTGQPKVSPLAQNNGSNHSSNGSSNGSHASVSPAATLGAAAMGMPFQVFPTGPPAPPPPPPPTGRVLPGANGAGTSRPMPPPPPPPGPAEVRKSPRPQVFEAPPMGMRPEIKIPPNPMANLRKAPRPQPKNDFWIEEYRREKQQDSGPPIPRPVPPPSYSYTQSRDLDDEASPPWMSSRHNSLKEQPEWVHRDDQQSQPGATTSSTERTPPPQEKEQQTVTSTSNNNNNNNKNKEPQALRAAAVATGKSESETTKIVDSIVTAPTPVSARPSPPSSQQLTQNSVRPSADVYGSAQQSTTPSAQQQQQQQQQQYVQQLQQAARAAQPSAGLVQSTVTMPVSRGYPQQGSVYAQAQPVYSPQPAAGSQKERIIPIQIEKSPVQSPATAPSFAPPPYYSPAPQYGPPSANSASSVQSPVPIGFATPHSGFTTPTAMFTNPNHFVNQGYNNISYPPTPTAQPQPHPMYQHHQHYAPPQTPPLHHHPMHPQPPPAAQQQQQRMQQQSSATNVRIVPIKVEGAEHTARGPLSNTPAIIQSDPRSSSNTQAWNGNNAPNQSRSFRVLQQITDTLDESETGKGAKESNSEVAGHDQADGQQHGRNAAQMTHQPESADGQMRRLQLSNEDKALMNRVKTQGSGNRTQQMFNRGNNNETDGESPAQYVPPSEQKVEEPKKYTGGSIPSRSFRMLQAMTGSDAPDQRGEAKNKQ